MAVETTSQPAAEMQRMLTAAYEQYGAMVYNVCLRILRNPQAAEDASQAVFLLFVKKAGAYAMDPARLPGWLHHMAELVCRESLRAQSRRERRENEAAMMQSVSGEAEPEQVWSEVRPKLDRAIADLPEKYRTPLVMVYLSGHSQKEVAQTLRLNDGTLRWRLSHAIETLRQKLGGDKRLSVALLALLL